MVEVALHVGKDTQGETAGRAPRRARRSRRDEPYALYQRSSDGRWVGRFRLPGGRYRYFTGATKREVLEGREGRGGLRDALRLVEAGQPVPDERLTFGAYLERWALRPVVAAAQAAHGAVPAWHSRRGRIPKLRRERTRCPEAEAELRGLPCSLWWSGPG